MDLQKINNQIIILAMESKAIAMQQCPVRTGRMMRSIQIIWHEDGFSIKVPEEIEYFKYTDEAYTLRGGKDNYNYGWFSERTFELISRNLTAKLQGNLSKVE